MYQRDYILRMLEMLGDVLAAITGLVKKHDYDKAAEAVEQVYPVYMKKDAEYFRSLPEEDLIKILADDDNYSAGHMEMLAEIFLVESELALVRGDREACRRYSARALLLFEHTELMQKTLSLDRLEKMRKLRDRI